MVKRSQRAAVRLILSFGLDAFRTAAELVGDYDRGLLFILIAHANVETFDLKDGAAAFSRTPVPDSQRRAISANAVAVELGVPRETVRRQVNELIDMGMVVRDGARGLIVPTDVVLSPAVAAAQERILIGFCDLAKRTIETGFIWPDEGRPSAWAGRPRPDFLIHRHILAFTLRLAALTLGVFGQFEDALVFHAITEANLRHVTDDPELSGRYASTTAPAPPDELRRPVTTKRLVERTLIPRATMNRTLRRLADAGLVQRQGRGVIARAEVFDAGPIFAATDQAALYLTQAAARLASAGVTGGDLCRWTGRDGPPEALAS